MIGVRYGNEDFHESVSNFEKISTGIIVIAKSEVLDLITQYPNGYSSTLRYKHKDLIEHLNTEFSEFKTIGEKLYNWVYDDIKNSCITCGQRTKFKQFSHGYFEFCSPSCRAKHFECYKNAHDDDGNLKGIEKIRKNAQAAIKLATETCVTKYGKTPQEIMVDAVKQTRFQALPLELQDRDTLLSIDLKQHRKRYNLSDLKFAYKTFGLTFPRFTDGRSKHENDVAEYLRNLGVSFTQSNKILSNRREVDLMIGDKFGIEYCGLFWHSDRNGYDKNKHQQKFLECRELGIKLFTIFEDEWLFKTNIVKSKIANSAGLNDNKIFARKCQIATVDSLRAKTFLNETHIAGARSSASNICLLYGDEIVACLTYGKSRYEKGSTEIIRYSTKLGTNIIGGFSRLISKLKSTVKGRIISYSDNRWGDGSMYLKAGFLLDSITPPSYYYFKLADKIRFHRSAFMKHVIIDKMNGRVDLTEVENMRRFGYNRIFDCGSMKWVME